MSQQQPPAELQQPAITEATTDKLTWLPIECDPEILQSTLNKYGVHDGMVTEVYQEELFDMVPQPIESLIVLYPIHDHIEKHLDDTFTTIDPMTDGNPHQLTHVVQRIGNACGTMALLHYALNKRSTNEFLPNSPFQQLSAILLPVQTGLENAELLEENAELLQSIHQAEAQSDLSQTVAEDYANTAVHYLCFIEKDGILWLLDGRRKGPMECGPCSADDLLSKAWAVVKEIYKVHNSEQDLAAFAISKIA